MYTSNRQHITGPTDDGDVFLKPCHLRGVVVGTPGAGETLAIHDCANTAAANSGNSVSEIALDDAQHFDFFNVAIAVGLVAIISGAADVTVIWG